MISLHLRKSIDRSPLRCGFILIPLILMLAGSALLQTARAQCDHEGCNQLGNTFLGQDTLVSNTTGYDNTATGRVALFSNTTGFSNTATGSGALFSNTTGYENTAIGDSALLVNTTGINNTAVGAFALESNTGSDNTADGYQALLSNTTGTENTATGVNALSSNTTGAANTATGIEALAFNTTGFSNTATAAFALQSNTTGFYNTAIGFEALLNNTTGNSNTANGEESLFSNTAGSNNTAIGIQALWHNSTGSSNIALGPAAGINLTTGSNNIDIGNTGVAGEANKIRIGTKGTQTTTFIAGISGTTVSDGVGVVVGTNGKLGTTTSSARFKDSIKPMDKMSETIFALKPVTFRYKKELDPVGIPQFGLVAEEVDKVNPDLVARDEQGKPYTVRYEAVNTMLLNEFLKDHKRVEEQAGVNQGQESTIAELRSSIAQQQKEIKALTMQVQKVSEQLEATKPTPQLIVNNP